MKVAVVSPHPVLPATSGDRIRTAQLISTLREKGVDAELIAWRWPWTPPEELVGGFPCDFAPGQPSSRLARLLSRPRLAWDGQRNPFALFQTRYARTTLQEVIRRSRADVVDFQHSYMWAPTAGPNVVTLVDVHSHRLSRHGLPVPPLVVEMERRAIGQADHVVALSSIDAERARAIVPERSEHITSVPLGCEPDLQHRKRQQSDRLATIAYVGSFEYQPNQDAARSLLRLWPDLRVRLGLQQLVLAGRMASRYLERHEGVTVLSDVPSMSAVLSSVDVLVVPLLTGGGVRVKILEAFALNVPVVTTAVGIEGIEAVDGVHAMIVSGVEALGEGIERMADRNVRDQVVENAHQLWRARYSPSAMASSMMRVYQAVRVAHGARPFAAGSP